MKPKLTREQKAFLILELMEWATDNKAVMAASSPQMQTFNVIRSIQRDDADPIHSSNGETFIKELKKNGLLWAKILPFLKNSNGGCTRKVVEGYGVCHHGKEQHADGKCTGVHMTWYDENGKYINPGRSTPCSCNSYKSTQTW